MVNLILAHEELYLIKVFFNDRITLKNVDKCQDFLDLSILDEVTENKIKHKLIIYMQKVLRCSIYKKIILNQNSIFQKIEFLSRFILAKILIICIGRYKVYRLQGKLCTLAGSKDSQNYSLLSSDTRYLDIKFPKEWFKGNINVKFEDLILPTTRYLDIYLEQQYGDITKDPPKSEQIPAHVGNNKFIFDYYKKMKL